MKITFTKSDLDVMRLDAVDLLRETHYTHWENTLRTFFDEHECGTPTPETLRNHGRWLIPHPSQTRGLLHKLFQWRGQIVFEGWADIATGRHVIHPHTADTPKPWGHPQNFFHHPTNEPYTFSLTPRQPASTLHTYEHHKH